MENLLHSQANVFDNFPEAIVTTNTVGDITGWNKAAEALYGWQAEEAIGQRLEELIKMEYQEGETCEMALARLIAEGYWRGNTIQTKRDGTRFIAASTVNALQDETGRLVGTVGINRDITTQVRAEIELRQSEERLRLLAQHMPVMLDALDADGNIIVWNKECERVTGYSAAEIVGNPRAWEMLYPDPAYRHVIEAERSAYGSNYRNVERQITCKDGSIKTIAWSSDADLFPVPGWASWHIGVDVTERVHTQATLYETLQAFQALFDSSPVAVIVIDRSCRVMMWSPAAERTFGWSAAEVTGRLLPIVPPDYQHEFYLLNDRVWDGEALTNVEVRRQRKDGSLIDISLSAAPLRDANGKIYGAMAVMLDISGRKRMEAALREANGVLRALNESSPLAVTVTDLDGKITMWNPAAERMFGWQAEEVLGQPNPSVPETFQPQRLELRNRVLQGETLIGLEQRRQCKDGTLIDVEVSLAPLYDAAGDIHGVISVIMDITKRKRTEAAEREQRILAKALRDSAAAMVSTLEPQVVMRRILENVGRVVPHDSANIMLIEEGEARVVYWRGYAPEAEIYLRKLRLPLDIPTLRAMIETGCPYLIPDTLADPKWIRMPQNAWVRSYVSAPLQTRAQVIGFLNLNSATLNFYTTDHAERLRAFADQAAIAIENAQLYDESLRYADQLERRVAERTAALQSEQARLRTILDAMGEGLVYEEQNRPVFVNQAFVHMSGYSQEELRADTAGIYHRLLNPIPGRKDLEETVANVARQGRTWQGEFKIQRKDGSEFDAGVTMAAVTGPEGIPIGSVALFRDVTQERSLQAQKDRFITHASHELRTPITNLKTHLYLLARQPDRLNEHLAVLEEVAEYMSELIENLLEITRLQTTTLLSEQHEAVLQTLVADALEYRLAQAQARLIRLESDFPTQPLRILGDPARITRAVASLIDYAIRQTPPEGEVQVGLVQGKDGKQRHALITVRDGGPGTPPDLLAGLFEPFARASEGGQAGSGLGLAIARRIVELHGGTIAASSQAGQGTTFTLRLPLL